MTPEPTHTDDPVAARLRLRYLDRLGMELAAAGLRVTPLGRHDDLFYRLRVTWRRRLLVISCAPDSFGDVHGPWSYHDHDDNRIAAALRRCDDPRAAVGAVHLRLLMLDPIS